MSRALQAAAAQMERQRNAAQHGVQQQRRVLQGAQAQWTQLQQYAHSTSERWGMQSGNHIAPEVLHHYGQFMARLEHALGLQTQVVQQQQHRLAQATQTLQQAQMRLMALQRVLTQRQAESQRRMQRQEQHTTDERAAVQWNNRLCPTP